MSNIIIPSSESDRQKIRGVISDISNSMTRIDSEKDYIKQALNGLSETVGIPKKILSKMARIYHKQNMNDVKTEFDDIETVKCVCMEDDELPDNE